MRRKNNPDNFGMPFIPNLSDYINAGQSGVNPLASGVKKVAKATSFDFHYDERESTKNQRKRRRADLFERGQRLNSGEAPLSDIETYQYSHGSDYLGGKNRPERNHGFGLF